MLQKQIKTQAGESPNRLIRIREVMELTGLSKSYIYLLAVQDRFPKSIPLVPGGTSRAWVYSEVQDYITQRVADRDQEVVQ